MSLLHNLLSNLAVVAIAVHVWNLSRPLVPKFGRRLNLVLFGLLFGAGAVAVMNMPFQIGNGVFIDLRIVFTGLSAYYGGPLAGAITAALAIVQRCYMGGDGAVSGVASIMASFVIGLSGQFLPWEKRLNIECVLGLSAAQALTAQLFFLAIPGEVGREAFAAAFPVFPLILILAISMCGLAMSQELRWRRTQKMNSAYKAVIDALPDCLNAKDTFGRFIVANPATAELMRARSERELIGKTDFDFYPRLLAEQFATDEEALRLAGISQVIEQSFERRDGSTGVLQTLKSPFRDESGKLIGIITHNRDITDSKLLEANYVRVKEKLALAMENMADALVSFGSDGRIQFCNSNFPKLFPLSSEARCPGGHFRDMITLSFMRNERTVKAGDSLASFISGFEATLQQAGVLEFELTDGRWIEAESRPQPDGSCLMTYHDITVSKRTQVELLRLNEKLETLATTDGLTGLRNRRAFDQALEQAAQAGSEHTVLLADIDHFKAYNDRYGHPAGDEVIKAVAACLSDAVQAIGGFSARYGGEELAAILPFPDIDRTFEVGNAFRRSVEALGIVHGGSAYGMVSVSVGVSSLACGYPVSIGDLLKAADEALYSAKDAGRNTVKCA